MSDGGVGKQAAEGDLDAVVQHAAAGGMVVLHDPSCPHAGGWLVLPADHVNPQAITFMACQGRGLVCLALTEERVGTLRLPLMPASAGRFNRPVFTVSIEARQGVSTGISAADRAATIAVAIRPESGPEALVTPGHVFPLVAQSGGLLARQGIAEAAVDLARIAGLSPAAVVCQILDEDGDVACADLLEKFAAQHRLPIAKFASISSRLLIARPRLLEKERTVVRDEAGVSWRMVVFTDQHKVAEHVALVLGDLDGSRPLPHVILQPPLAAVLQPGEAQDTAEALIALRRSGRGIVLQPYAASGQSMSATRGAERPEAASDDTSGDSRFLAVEMLRKLGLPDPSRIVPQDKFGRADARS